MTDLKLFKLPLWKRVFDILFALIALVILSPLLLVVAVAIYIEDKGAVIYKSPRAGSNYKIFNFLKFRSMYVNADKRLSELEKLNQYGDDNNRLDTELISDLSEDVILGDDSMLISDDFVVDDLFQHHILVGCMRAR